jgi:inactivated superfamily I helicase
VSTPDLSEFEQLSNPKKRRCLLGTALEAVGDERPALEAALAADDRVSAGGVVSWLKRRGVTANNSAVVHHRNGRCNCADA